MRFQFWIDQLLDKIAGDADSGSNNYQAENLDSELIYFQARHSDPLRDLSILGHNIPIRVRDSNLRQDQSILRRR